MGTDSGYDQYFNRPNPLGTQPQAVSGMVFDSTTEVQTKRIPASASIGTSGLDSVSFTLGTKAGENIIATINPKNYKNMTMAIPMVALYEGTSADKTNQIWPLSSHASQNNNFKIIAGYDYQEWSAPTQIPPGTIPIYTNTVFSMSILNENAGTTANIFGLFQWKYMTARGGTTSASAP